MSELDTTSLRAKHLHNRLVPQPDYIQAIAGLHLDGLQHLAFHCLLHDHATVKGALVEDDALHALEDLVSSAEAGSSLASMPHIIRVLHSAVSRIARLTDSLWCLEVLLNKLCGTHPQPSDSNQMGDLMLDGNTQVTRHHEDVQSRILECIWQ